MDPELIDIVLSFLSKLVNQNTEIINLLKQQNELTGTTYPNTFTLQVGKPVTKIDFTDAADHKNLPANVSLFLPSIPVSSVLLINDGPGDLGYATNTTVNSYAGASKLFSGETRQITIPNRKIQYLNVVANNADVALRMEVLI